MRAKAYKRVCVEYPHGEVIGIIDQKYPVEAQNRHILDLHTKEGWYWCDDYTGWALTNSTIVMRVHVCYEYYETMWDKLKAHATKNWVHFFK